MICFQDFVPIFLVLDLLGRLYTTHEHPFWGLIAILTNILVFRMNDIYRTWSLAWANFLVSGYIGLHGNHDLYYDLWLLTLFCTYFLLIKAYVGSAILAISLLRLQNDRDSEAKLWAYASLLLAITFPHVLAKLARITGISSFLNRLSVTIRIYFLYLFYITYFSLADISNSIYVTSSNLITTIRRLFARRLLAAAVCLDPSLNRPKPKTKSTFEISNVVATVDVVPRLPPVQAIATQTELLEEELNTQIQAAFSAKKKPIPKILRVIQQRKTAGEVKSPRLNGSQRVARPWQQRKEREQQEQEQDEKERLEKERQEKEQREKKQREQERREKEQLQKERQEKDRREKEKHEKERQWKEQLERKNQRDQQQPAPTANSASPVSVSAPVSAPVPQIAPVGIAAVVPAPRAPVPAGIHAQPETDPAGAEPEPESESAPYARIFPVEPAVDEDKPGESSPQRPTIPIGERRILKPRSRKAKKAPQRQPEQQRQERPEQKVALLLPSLSQKEPQQQQQQEQKQQEEKEQDEDEVMVNVAPPAPPLHEQQQQQQQKQLDDQEELLQELQEELILALLEDEPTPSQEPQKEQHRGQEQEQEQEQEQPQLMDAEATPLTPPRPLAPPQQLLPAAMDVDQPQEGRFGDIKNINTSFLLSPPKKKASSALVWPPRKTSQPTDAAQPKPKPKPAKKEPPTEEEKKKVVADVMRRRKAQASSPFLPKKKPTPKKAEGG
ncbi:hypothetical protein DL765_008939 [Monosporascus sp. GIB2]|nr:hypothetical protein DL765_008939 [Monosporascus sp. GIB2]